MICVRGNDRVRGYTMCNTRGIYSSRTDIAKLSQIQSHIDQLLPAVSHFGGVFTHYKGDFDDTCDIVGEVERDSQRILQNWVRCSTLCEYLNSGYTLINCYTVTRPLETRRACFTLSGRLKEATEDWVQRGNWTEIARLSQSCTVMDRVAA